jgi:hypothetical protein
MTALELTDVAAELPIKGAWQTITLEQALGLDKSRRMRCPECHGQVRAHGVGKDGQRPHMEHKHRNKGCSRGDCFDGHPAMHPKALK